MFDLKKYMDSVISRGNDVVRAGLKQQPTMLALHDTIFDNALALTEDNDAFDALADGIAQEAKANKAYSALMDLVTKRRKTATKAEPKLKPEAKPKTTTGRNAKPQKAQKPKPEKKDDLNTIAETKPVTVQSREVYHIKRFLSMHMKEVDKAGIDRVLSALQKDILEGKLRKTSPHADEIQNIQQILIKMYEDADKTLTVKIGDNSLERLRYIADQERVEWSVFYAKK